MFTTSLWLTVLAPFSALCIASTQVGAEAPAGMEAPQAVAAAAPLEIAFEAVSRMPLRPHVKTRSRLQADLVQAALDSDQLGKAMVWTQGIANWRRGLALGHIAVYQAQHADEETARKAIQAAEAFEATILAEEDQGWRRDRVRVRIAEAYALLGDAAAAAAIQATATPSESGRLAAMAVRTVADANAGVQMETLETIAKTGDLEQIRYALLAMGEFYGRALTSPVPEGAREESGEEASALDAEAIEKRIRAAWTELPIEPRIDILTRLVDFDIQAAGAEAPSERALAHAREVAQLVADNRWNPEQGIALRARAAVLLQRAGDAKAARAQANDALALYETSRDGIVDIFRGEALRPLAEAYVALGDSATATMVYERALGEALKNPNSRPRATDLAMTAISAATAPGYVLPKSLDKAFQEAAKAIGDPW